MKYLYEYVNWVNSIKEVDMLTEGKGHMDHPEDMVILGGIPGYMPLDQALATMQRAAKDPKKITIKFDGYPAIIFGAGADGKFTIMDKHMFNRGANRPQIHSPQQFAEYEAQRGDKGRSGLVELVGKIWAGLQKNYTGPGYYMGDLLFHDVLKDEGGMYKFRPNPNGILYQVQVDSDIGKLLTGKVSGIAVHRYLSPEAANTEDQVTWLSDLGNLQNASNVALLPVTMPVTPKININEKLRAGAESAKASEQQIYDFISGAPQSAAVFANNFTVYINSKVAAGNLKNLYTDFGPWITQRLDSQVASNKLKQEKRDAILDYLKKNNATVKQLFKNWINVYNYKMDIVKQIDQAAKSSPIKGYLQSGQESQEGFVYGGLKFIDRMGFSAQNLAAKQAVTEESAKKSKLLVVYPGGFHPFHLGHASVYQHLVKRFPNADVYVAATDTTTERPFNFPDKKILAQNAGVPNKRFVKVKSPYRAEEITSVYDPKSTVLVFALSEKDKDRISFQPKKDGSPSYFQPYSDGNLEPLNKHAYIYVTPKINFTVLKQKIDSASKIRQMYAKANDDQRMKIAQDLYPQAPDINAVKQILDKYLAPTIAEADNPNYFGGSSLSPIGGTPKDLIPGPDPEEVKQYHKDMADMQRFLGRK